MVIIFIIMTISMQVLETRNFSDWLSANQHKVEKVLGDKEKIVPTLNKALKDSMQRQEEMQPDIPLWMLPLYLWLIGGILFGIYNICNYIDMFQKRLKTRIKRIRVNRI